MSRAGSGSWLATGFTTGLATGLAIGLAMGLATGVATGLGVPAGELDTLGGAMPRFWSVVEA